MVANRVRRVLEHRRLARKKGFSKSTSKGLKMVERGD